MGKVSAKLRSWEASDGAAGYSYWCQGCESYHSVSTEGPGARWGFNGNLDLPTFTPSVLVRSGHHVQGHEGMPCWCTYNAEHPDDPSGFTCGICHTFITNGVVQFLSDCTHALAGKTLPLPDLPDPGD